MRHNDFNMFLIQSHNFVDFDAEQDYTIYSVKVDIVSGSLQGKKLRVTNELKLHEAEFNNNLYSPLKRDSDKFSYMSSGRFSTEKNELSSSEKKKELLFIEISTVMSGMKQIEQRIRYNYWDLLADVGGFNDGCFLLASLFMSFYASLNFRMNYINGTHVEDENVISSRRFKQSGKLRKLFKRLQAGQQLDEQKIATLTKQRTSVTIISDSLLTCICEIVCCRSKEQRLVKEKIMQDFESHLDLRQIMRTQFDLRLLIKLLLREKQRVLFKHQLSRLISNTGGRPK